jgi:hypothetical protein
MRRSAIGCMLAGLLGLASPLQAQETTKAHQTGDDSDSGKSASHRKKAAQVQGYTARHGGYSLTKEDTVNIEAAKGTRYREINTYPLPGPDRQSTSGPFDHGFFCDSGILPRGGDSPYLN